MYLYYIILCKLMLNKIHTYSTILLGKWPMDFIYYVLIHFIYYVLIHMVVYETHLSGYLMINPTHSKNELSLTIASMILWTYYFGIV